jgi:hypothetical protein
MAAKKGLKAAMCEKLIGEGKVGLYDMIRHSYTNARMSRAGGGVAQHMPDPRHEMRLLRGRGGGGR